MADDPNKNATTDKNAPSAQSNPNPEAIKQAQTGNPPARETKSENLGRRPNIIQSPVAPTTSEIVDDAVGRAERERIAREQAEADERSKELPQTTIDEIEAGKAALKRHAVAAPQAVAPKE